jgi:hypothetical protein
MCCSFIDKRFFLFPIVNFIILVLHSMSGKSSKQDFISFFCLKLDFTFVTYTMLARSLTTRQGDSDLLMPFQDIKIFSLQFNLKLLELFGFISWIAAQKVFLSDSLKVLKQNSMKLLE